MRKLDRGIAARIFEELDEIAKLEDPRVRGKSLTGNLAACGATGSATIGFCATSMTAGS